LTSRAHIRSRSISSCRWIAGFDFRPKCVRNSASGCQARIFSTLTSHASMSMSGGGVGGTIRCAGGIDTPATSPTKAIRLGSS
jgi:hypothetical protein